MKRLLLSSLMVWTLSGFSASAQVPKVIPFQGYLTNAQGVPYEGDVLVEFGIYNRNGELVFFDKDTLFQVNGIINTNIGDKEDGEGYDYPVPVDKLDAGSYVKVLVNGQLLEGDIPLGSAPFALFSNSSASSAGWVQNPGSDQTTTSFPVLIEYVSSSGTFPALIVNQSGAGTAALIRNKNTSSNAAALAASTDANTGAGIFAGIPNTSNVNAALYGQHDGANGFAGYFINSATNGIAGRFDGRVQINGTLTKSGGAFRIDHPLDPTNKYLQHSFVESPDMMNIYNGNVTLDGSGEAFVELPAWFGALNKDFRYQLTCVGGFAPVYVAEKIQGNRFRIAGGRAGLEVSWQVTGIRQDAYANQRRIEVEVEKTGRDRGKYLYPELFGLPPSMGVQHELQQYADEQMNALKK